MHKSPLIGVLLSGCGVFDGSEIQEVAIAMLCLDQLNARFQCMAPNKTFAVIDHLTRQPTGETRNVMIEAARIARGHVMDLAQVNVAQYDGFLVPGGFGVAKNLCTFAAKGVNCDVEPHVTRILVEAQRAGKPLGFMCIAPALAARIFGPSLHPQVTIGHDHDTALAVNTMGATNVPCHANDFILDGQHHILSTPAYMEAKTIKEVYEGTHKMVAKLVELCGAR